MIVSLQFGVRRGCVGIASCYEIGKSRRIANPYGQKVNIISGGQYKARWANGAQDMARAYALRQQCFRGGMTAPHDRDAHDDICRHLLIEEPVSGSLVGYCRVLVLKTGLEAANSYSARHYDLSALARHPVPMLEIGRFCIRPDCQDPDILRLVWSVLTRLVDHHGVAFLFGCTSFVGTDGARHSAAFQHLAQAHLASPATRPGVLSKEVWRLHPMSDPVASDPRSILSSLPPLLRSYLALGGQVGDHAVIDRDLGTMHVFTVVEVAAIPAARARQMRALAARGVTTD
jgi:L-ornithine Nalpha-acyltransferase